MTPGTPEKPLRVAIIGSGPSAFYMAEQLQKQEQLTIEIDMFERLPTPFGLVRGGVAPDHPKIKSVTKVYDKVASHPNFRFYGNVTFGEDISHTDLALHYHVIIYAVGAQTDRRMNIPGEDLPGSHAATEFVGWYNAHPDYCDLEFDLSHERVAVVGNGNVAMDVARILARTPDELKDTDIADYALEVLRHSKVKEIYVLGRRGPVQAKFTAPEIKEFGEIEGTTIVVPPEEIELDTLSRDYLLSADDRTAEQNYQMLKQYAQNGHMPQARQIILRFLVSPVEIIGDGRVEAIKIVRNELYKREDGTLRQRATVSSRRSRRSGVPLDWLSGHTAAGRAFRHGAWGYSEYPGACSEHIRPAHDRRIRGWLDQTRPDRYYRHQQARCSRNGLLSSRRRRQGKNPEPASPIAPGG
jgi:ferredoxin--NADP+ reductase